MVNPKLISILISDKVPLIKPDSNKGIIQAAYFAGNLVIDNFLAFNAVPQFHI